MRIDERRYESALLASAAFICVHPRLIGSSVQDERNIHG